MLTPLLRKRVIEEWRGLPEEARPDRTVSVREAVEKLIARLGLADQIREEAILTEWRDLVGDFLAEHSRPSRLVQGILQVLVLQPTIRYELDRAWKPKLLRKLQARFGATAIREIQFRT